MTGATSDNQEFVRALISDIDAMTATAKSDLRQLNQIGRYLRHHRDNGNITELHYTVDKVRLKRTIAKCKLLLYTLSQHRLQATKLLKDG